jgi:hypothetical protein
MGADVRFREAPFKTLLVNVWKCEILDLQARMDNGDRSVPRKPRPVGGVKGHNINDKSLPGSPALCAGSFTQGGAPSELLFVSLSRNKEKASRFSKRSSGC